MRVVFVGKDRVVWKRVVLYLVTFGISRRIWLHKVNKEIDGHAALGIPHRLNVALLVLPVVGPFIVQCRTTQHLNDDLHADEPLSYGPTWALCLLGLVPILGNAFYIGWTQDRLNKYWAIQRGNQEHGIDIDVGLEKDKKFLIELDKARRESYAAGSRFDRKQRKREERWRRHVDELEEIRLERERVRALGGSTPVLPWKRPEGPPKAILHITCGTCSTTFDVEQDPYRDTRLECPKCGTSEVLPAVHGGGAGSRVLQVSCPQCDARFKAEAPEEGPVPIQCPECGLEDTLQTA